MLMRIKHHTPNFTFISDSIFKFLSKDKMSLQYIMQNDHKCNIRLFRGYSASQVVHEVTDNMSHMPQSGITAMVSTFGTVDLTHTSGAQVEIAHTHTHRLCYKTLRICHTMQRKISVHNSRLHCKYPGQVIDAVPIPQSVGKQQHSSISTANNTP